MIMVWIHEWLNLFHLVSLLLVAGLGIDYGLFLSRPAINHSEQRQTLFSVSIGAISTFVMFAMLGLSAIPALKSIGVTVAVGIAVSFLTAIMLTKSDRNYLIFGRNARRAGQQ
jgi:predicted exporter